MTTAETPSQNFRNLYPEIDPTTPIRLGRGEHLAIVASTGILVFGAAAGDLRVTGAGFALFLISIIIPPLKRTAESDTKHDHASPVKTGLSTEPPVVYVPISSFLLGGLLSV